jgi:hypothetical protein
LGNEVAEPGIRGELHAVVTLSNAPISGVLRFLGLLLISEVMPTKLPFDFINPEPIE